MKDFDYDKTRKDIVSNVKAFAEDASKNIHDGFQWSLDHPEVIIAGIGAMAALIKSTQSLTVSHRAKKERARIDHTWYDPSTGFHWELRRRATNADRAEIIRRKAAGQDMYEILTQLRLIK